MRCFDRARESPTSCGSWRKRPPARSVRLWGSSSAAGAAGSVVLGLVVACGAAQVLLYGAEVIGATTDRRGRPPGPADDRAEEG